MQIITNQSHFNTWSVLMLRYLDQETATGPFWSSSQAATCYYQR